MKKGRLDFALSSWSRAVELNPDAAPALNNLAWVLAATNDSSARNPAKAVEFALRASKLTNYQDPAVLDVLAVAYAAAGAFPKAIQTAEQALTLAETANQKELANELRQHLRLYRADKPYFDK